MKISELDFRKLLPVFMRDDEAVKALCHAVDELLQNPCKSIPNLRTWDRFDELTEAECDEMAYELDIDWYDYSVALPEKRETVKYAQEIKRRRGTKWAVERLVSSYFGNGVVSEWFDTDEKPFTFSITSENPGITEEMYGKFIDAVNASKNERSHLSGMTHIWNIGSKIECSIEFKQLNYEIPVCGAWICGQERD